ncbi:heavy-metal-associated domain-containing protein [Neolewinella antarctica]|uniref:Copper chaperone CopZ n=1 Tax=Neolewinella antarctica TaxID=442734 RepID=A0ABX0X9A2_9BACT|nr:heavy metal-associated domain-containing protein [Neolewinella antarctica]NJC25846.1 copper chaperone CopZ [Neolewinella antarctica]
MNYEVKGMTCGSCVNNVRKGLEKVQGLEDVQVQLARPQVQFNTERAVPVEELQAAIGHYEIKPIAEPKVSFVETPVASSEPTETAVPEPSLTAYRPLLLIVGFIAGVSLLAQYPFADFNGGLWMRHFMAGFFIVFAFFKLLNIGGFADSYRMYDIVAAKWPVWGYVYPFIELGLGVLYLINVFPFWTNVVTIVVLGVSSIGVIQSNLNKRKIKCACLGDVFNLSMSTVTIVEDVSMVVMAGLMLISIG